jgi:2-phospho-L-lactate transferase/gluconeogenesis factor (CofD/UPF0052 family)
MKIFICNLATQPGETDGYRCGDHIRALEAHVGPGFVDMVLGSEEQTGEPPAGSQWVTSEVGLEKEYALYRASLADPDRPGHHQSTKLAQLLIDLLQERTGPLNNAASN